MTLLDEPTTKYSMNHATDSHDVAPDRPVVLTRRGIDRVLIGFGVLAAVVFAVAGALLSWGANFSDDYVYDELTAQRITMPDADTMRAEGLDEYVKFAGTPLDSGAKAEAYAQYIDGHLQNTGAKYAAEGAEPLTYAELGGPERAARAAVTEAIEAGAPEAEIAELQEASRQVTADRDSLFKGETLRGLLLSAYAWATVGQIAGYAAIGAFVAAGLMAVLVALGLVHYRRMTRHVVTA
ncbi:MAG TPA: hypothetical protein VNQ73_06495 [Ilumatobacter sp.]|nr:hypothetical protein [Ilumatobacter sp.]